MEYNRWVNGRRCFGAPIRRQLGYLSNGGWDGFDLAPASLAGAHPSDVHRYIHGHDAHSPGHVGKHTPVRYCATIAASAQPDNSPKHPPELASGNSSLRIVR